MTKQIVLIMLLYQKVEVYFNKGISVKNILRKLRIQKFIVKHCFINMKFHFNVISTYTCIFIDYNCFDNQLYHKMKIICKKRVTCKKKQGDFNFAAL